MKKSPKEIEESASQIARRGVIMGGLFMGVGGILAARMRHLQVERAEDFRLLAEDNRVSIRVIPPERGLIFDRSGVLLAGNEQNYRIAFVRENADDVDAVLERLTQVANLNIASLSRLRDRILSADPWVPLTIAEGLSWDEFAAVAVNAPALPGVVTEVGLRRAYPLGGDFAHLVGYVRDVPEDYVERTGDNDPVLRIPSFQVGLLNVEQGMESTLRGEAGNLRVEVNSRGRVMRELGVEPATTGKDVQLTVDAGLQNYVEARLGGESAGAVVMDCVTGDVLSLASAPTFDPTLFSRPVLPARIYNGLLNDPYRPLANKATQGLYPPGSTYKMIVALAGLEGGFITPDETIHCPGSVEVGNRRFHCWKRSGHGRMNMVESLSQSCDVYYYELAQRVGIENISAMARRFGFGIEHDLPLSSVAAGLAPTMDWKLQRFGQEWVVGDTLNASIGQGFVLSSPLQLAVMTARLASGKDLQARLIRSIGGVPAGRQTADDLGIDAAHLEIVRRGMWQVNNDRRGTAYSSRVVSNEYTVAGKTGTSQVRGLTYDERGRVIPNSELPWEDRDHALYVGYAPFDAPRYAVAVIVEHGGGGSSVAAPIGRDILLRAQLGDVPSPSHYPSTQRRQIQEMHDNLPLLETPIRPSGREPRRA